MKQLATSKLFHTVVILGMSLVATETACSSSDTEPTPSTSGTSTSSGSTTSSTSGSVPDAGSTSSSGALEDAHAATDAAFAGWFCCG